MEHLSPREAASRLGVTVKALKVYERHGLVAPHRLENGYRAYGPDQIVRVHEIKALQAMGLSLARIADLLAGRVADLARTLDLHEGLLKERRAAADRALALIAAVRRRLAAGEALTAAELLDLPQPTPPRAWGPAIQRHYEQHLAPGDLANLAPTPDVDWGALIAELKALSTADADPASPVAQNFMRRWVTASDRVARGDSGVQARAYQAWQAALDDPDTAAVLPLGKPDIAYLSRLGAAFAAGR